MAFGSDCCVARDEGLLQSLIGGQPPVPAGNCDISEHRDTVPAGAIPHNDHRRQVTLANAQFHGPCMDQVLAVLSVFESHLNLRWLSTLFAMRPAVCGLAHRWQRTATVIGLT